MITNKNEAKAMTEHINVILNSNSIIQHVIQIKNGIIKYVNVNVTILVCAKKIIVEKIKYFKSITDTSVTKCDLIIIVLDNLLAKKTNTIATK